MSEEKISIFASKISFISKNSPYKIFFDQFFTLEFLCLKQSLFLSYPKSPLFSNDLETFSDKQE